jgi:hypothetical protein
MVRASMAVAADRNRTATSSTPQRRARASRWWPLTTNGPGSGSSQITPDSQNTSQVGIPAGGILQDRGCTGAAGIELELETLRIDANRRGGDRCQLHKPLKPLHPHGKLGRLRPAPEAVQAVGWVLSAGHLSSRPRAPSARSLAASWSRYRSRAARLW